MSTKRNRQPAGQPVGGQFATTTRAPSGIELETEDKADSVVQERLNELDRKSARLDAEANALREHVMAKQLLEAVPTAGKVDFVNVGLDGSADYVVGTLEYANGNEMTTDDYLATSWAMRRTGGEVFAYRARNGGHDFTINAVEQGSKVPDRVDD